MKNYLPPPADATADADLLVKNPLIVDGDTVRIVLHGGRFALIDLVDLPAVAHLRWSPDGNGYAHCRVWHDGELRYPRLHRFLLGDAAEGWDVDHINGQRWDCRRANLRPCSRRQNGLNRRANTGNQFGLKGVQRHKNGEYFSASNFMANLTARADTKRQKRPHAPTIFWLLSFLGSTHG